MYKMKHRNLNGNTCTYIHACAHTHTHRVHHLITQMTHSLWNAVKAACWPHSLDDLQSPLAFLANQVGHPQLLAVITLHIPHDLAKVKAQSQTNHMAPGEERNGEYLHVILSIKEGWVDGVACGPVQAASHGVDGQVPCFCLVDELWVDSSRVWSPYLQSQSQDTLTFCR